MGGFWGGGGGGEGMREMSRSIEAMLWSSL